MKPNARTKCINYEKCGNTHLNGVNIRENGWGLIGKDGRYYAICPECFNRRAVFIREEKSETLRRAGGFDL